MSPDGRRIALISGEYRKSGAVTLCDWRVRELATWPLLSTPVTAAFSPTGAASSWPSSISRPTHAAWSPSERRRWTRRWRRSSSCKKYGDDLVLNVELARRTRRRAGLHPAVLREAARIADARTQDAATLAWRAMDFLSHALHVPTLEEVGKALPYLEEAVRDPDHAGRTALLGRALYQLGR